MTIDTTYHYEAEGDKLTLIRTQDVEPILEFNKKLQNDTSLTRTKDLRRVAKIPMIIIEQWLKEGLDLFSNDPEMVRKIKQRLNDPAYRFLRTDISRI